jgi:hypothetical protein
VSGNAIAAMSSSPSTNWDACIQIAWSGMISHIPCSVSSEFFHDILWITAGRNRD